jgi:anti-sigma B factor antagonist
MTEIQTNLEDGVAILTCEGRLNMVAAPRLKTAIEQAVADGGTKVVVDISEATFIDSSGLGTLVAGLKRARQAGGDLRIAGAGEQAVAVLGLTNLDRILRPYPSVEAAVGEW